MHNAKIVRASDKDAWYRNCIGMGFYLWPSLSENYFVACLVFTIGEEQTTEPKMLLVHKRDILWL